MNENSNNTAEIANTSAAQPQTKPKKEKAPSKVLIFIIGFIIPTICILIIGYSLYSQISSMLSNIQDVSSSLGSIIPTIGGYLLLYFFYIMFYLITKSAAGTYRTNIELINLNTQILNKLDKKK